MKTENIRMVMSTLGDALELLQVGASADSVNLEEMRSAIAELRVAYGLVAMAVGEVLDARRDAA